MFMRKQRSCYLETLNLLPRVTSHENSMQLERAYKFHSKQKQTLDACGWEVN